MKMLNTLFCSWNFEKTVFEFIYLLSCSVNSVLPTYLVTYLVGNTFTIEGEMGEMATSFLREVLPSAVTISPEPLNIEGCLTTQNVRDGHIMGVQ